MNAKKEAIGDGCAEVGVLDRKLLLVDIQGEIVNAMDQELPRI
jgi:hypothetical protein